MRHKDSSLSHIRLTDHSRDITMDICTNSRHPDSVNCNGALSKRMATELPQSLFSYQTFLATIKDQETEDESVLVSDKTKIHIDDKQDDFHRRGRGRLPDILQRMRMN